MDITTINLSKCLHDQFKHKHASFEEVSKEYFLQLQNDNIRRPSLIFRTEDIELPDGNSEVTFYSLVYVNGKPTKYFVSRSVFVVPPSYFLGDKEDALIIQWLKSDKAVFLRQQRLTGKEEPSPKPFHMVLTPSETREVYECTRIFQQLDEVDRWDVLIDDDISTHIPKQEVEKCTNVFQPFDIQEQQSVRLKFDGDLQLPNFSLELDFLSSP